MGWVGLGWRWGVGYGERGGGGELFPMSIFFIPEMIWHHMTVSLDSNYGIFFSLRQCFQMGNCTCGGTSCTAFHFEGRRQ